MASEGSGTGQQGEQQPDAQQDGRDEQNPTEQEQAEMRQEMSDVQDNAPVRKNDPRTSVQKAEEYRFASNIPGDQTIPEKEYADYTLEYDEDDAVMNGKIPDVLLDVPIVKVDEINFELNDLRAKVNLYAKVLDLVELSVGVDAYLGRVKLLIKGVEAQALLKVRLDNVTAIIDRVLTTIDRNPQIVEKLVESVGSAVEDVGEGAGRLVGEGVNSAVEDVGEGAGQLVGEGANQAVADIGSGAGSAGRGHRLRCRRPGRRGRQPGRRRHWFGCRISRRRRRLGCGISCGRRWLGRRFGGRRCGFREQALLSKTLVREQAQP